MTTPDYAAVLADLTRRRDEMNAAIAAIAPLCGKTAPSIEEAVRPHKRAKKAKGKPAKKKAAAAATSEPVGDRRSPLDDQHAKAIALAKQGKGKQEIADAVGVKYSTVWNWSQKPDWPAAA